MRWMPVVVLIMAVLVSVLGELGVCSLQEPPIWSLE